MIDKIIETYLPINIQELRPEGYFELYLKVKKKDVERINLKSGWDKWDTCPICGSMGHTVEFKYLGVNLLKCTNCFHRYCDKVPKDLSIVYDSDEYFNEVEKLELTQTDYRVDRFGKERAHIVRSLFDDTDRNILDIGCGWGFFLSILKNQGFNCFGIELSKPVADYAKKKYALNIESLPVEEYEPKMQFDLITMFGLIEHLKDPIGILKRCKTFLKEKGYILIFTPNYESVAVKVQQEESNMVVPGFHLHLFTPNSMKKVAEMINMKIFSFETKGIDIGDMYSYHKYKGKHEVANFLLENANLLQSVIDKANCSTHIRTIFQK